MKQNEKTINEAQLRTIVSEAVKNVLKESYYTAYSGMEDYQGIGSEESRERVRKIKDKTGYKYGSRDAIFKIPGHNSKKDSTYDYTIRHNGGNHVTKDRAQYGENDYHDFEFNFDVLASSLKRREYGDVLIRLQLLAPDKYNEITTMMKQVASEVLKNRAMEVKKQKQQPKEEPAMVGENKKRC